MEDIGIDPNAEEIDEELSDLLYIKHKVDYFYDAEYSYDTVIIGDRKNSYSRSINAYGLDIIDRMKERAEKAAKKLGIENPAWQFFHGEEMGY